MARLYIASNIAWNTLRAGDDRPARQEIAEQQARRAAVQSEAKREATRVTITNPRVQLAVGAEIFLSSDSWTVASHERNPYGGWVTTLVNAKGFRTTRPLSELVKNAKVVA